MRFSSRNTEKLYDELVSKFMREYWQAHPEEFERLTKKLKYIKRNTKAE
jgi:hypothetical protein